MSYNILPNVRVQTDLDLATATVKDRNNSVGANGQVLSKDNTGLVWSTATPSLPATTFRVASGNLPNSDELTWTTGATADYTLSNTDKRINFTNSGIYLVNFSINPDVIGVVSNTYFTITVYLELDIIGTIGLVGFAGGQNPSNGSCSGILTASAGQQLYVRSDRDSGSGSASLFDTGRLNLTITKIG